MPEFKALTTRTKRLLASPEGFDVDFKSDAEGIKQKDLIAFANSANGGTILVGVEEYTNASGVQRGRVCGCSVDDGSALKIRNQAADCIPPIELEMITENINEKPIFRLEIPQSNKAPHCTKKGEYSIRSDRRTRGLFPEELLAIFLQKESEQFLDKFRQAITETEEKIDEMRYQLSADTIEIHDIVSQLKEEVGQELSNIFAHAEEASMNSDEAKSTIDEVWGIVNDEQRFKDIETDLSCLQKSVDAIVAHMGLSDPDLERKLARIEPMAYLFLSSGKYTLEAVIEVAKKPFPFLPDDIIRAKVTNIYEELQKSDDSGDDRRKALKGKGTREKSG